MWVLTKDVGTLDLNSPYHYLTLTHHFSDTCIVAEADEGIVGFVTGFVPPRRPDTLFVWQIGVAEAYQRGGIAHAMLQALLARLAADGVRYLEATVTPSNVPSQRMFRAFAERFEAPCEESLLFPSEVFPEGHEEERLLRIGPLAARELSRDETELVGQGER